MSVGAGADDNSSVTMVAACDADYSVAVAHYNNFESDSALLVAHNTGTEEIVAINTEHHVQQLDDGYNNLEAMDIFDVHKHAYKTDKNFDLNFAYNERFTKVAKLIGTYNYLDYIRAKDIHGVPRAMIDIDIYKAFYHLQKFDYF